MGSHYCHLTRDERTQIYTLLQEGFSKKHIAERLKRDYSTIKREIARNTGKRGYRHKQAQRFAEERRRHSQPTKMTPAVVAHIENKIRQEWSPEQISGTMQKILGLKVSIECIYLFILANKKNGGNLYTNLRIANGKKKRKRYAKKDYRGRIPGRVDISERPVSVDNRHYYGDWEADLVCGSHHRGFLVTLVERKSKLTRIGHVYQKTAAAVKREIIRLLRDYRVRTITYDNGREFWQHEEVNEVLGCASFFAAPYHSWERGLNENTNGLIRQYFPKGTDLREVDPAYIKFVEDRLNNRPRKTLDFQAPVDIINKVRKAA